MHSELPAPCDNELQPEPELALTPEPPLRPVRIALLKELRRARAENNNNLEAHKRELDSVRLQIAITKATKLVMQSGDRELMDDWSLYIDCMGRVLAREITISRQRAGARTASAQKRQKLTDETYQDALRRAPAEARRRGIKDSKKLVAQIIGVSPARLRKWEAENGK